MAKRKQVKNACVNCQKACKKCDDCRPCTRCVKYGIEDGCVNSSRKERRKGVKRGPYRSIPSSNRDLPDTEDSWTPGSERSVRTRRPINYRESKEVSDGEEGDGNDDDDDDGEVFEKRHVREQVKTSRPSTDDKHAALFKMVLGVMHGDLVIPTEQPKLLDLATVCSDAYEVEFLQQQHFQISQRLPIRTDAIDGLFINYEADRAENNRTPGPTEFVRRDAPSPPSTPLSIKLPQRSGYGNANLHPNSSPSSPYYCPMPIISTVPAHGRSHFNTYGSPY